jgi:hypothetical protein
MLLSFELKCAEEVVKGTIPRPFPNCKAAGFGLDRFQYEGDLIGRDLSRFCCYIFFWLVRRNLTAPMKV